MQLFCTMLATLTLCCLALLSPSQTWAQQNNTIATVAGGALPNATATSADIAGPSSAVEDANGNIYIASPSSYYVFKVNPATNTLSVFAGTGIQGFKGDGAAAIKATLMGPAALAIDSKSGNIYIVDLNRIRVITPDGNINTIAGTGGTCNPSTALCGDGGSALQAQFSTPQALAVDGSGNLFIADTGDMRIREVSGGVITTVVGNGKICDSPVQPCGDNGSATLAQLDLPAGVAVDAADNIYIGDTRDQRIRLVTAATGVISAYASRGISCTDPTFLCGDGGPKATARFHNPSAVSLDSAGNLYIADTLDNRIREVDSSGNQYIHTVAGTGTLGFAGDGGSAKSAELDAPAGIIVDSLGTLTITDGGNQRIRQVVNKNINSIAGGGTGGDSGAPTQATLAEPLTVFWDTAGNYYIADAANNRIRMVTPGGVISTVAGNGSAGYTGDGGPATAATLNQPRAVAVDAAGDIFIADTGNLVIREVNASTQQITTIAGNKSPCVPTTAPCGDGGPATKASITFVTAMALDGSANLYIADYFGNRIRKVDASGTISTLAGTGARGHTGDGGPAKLAKLNRPYGVAADAAGNVYIADSLDNKIRCVVGATGGCGGSALAVGSIFTYAFASGQPTFSGDGGPALKATMQQPYEVELDPAGNLYVGGGADVVVRRIDAASQTIVTVAGNPKRPGNFGFAGDGGPATQATLNNTGLAVNSSGALLIADTGNNRVRQVDLVAGVNLSKKMSFTTTPVGQTRQPLNANLKNTGLADLSISNVVITGRNSGDFAISQKTCGAQLAPGRSCSVSVTFTPQKTGTRSANLTITDNLGQHQVYLVGTSQ
ncbi:MAG TPA: choice-of-anchor D domain-containing protein [Terriglobales bacterium]|nr:choice-of-anchor D domain-containing protein [Terriglobales bacterium]